MACKAVSVRSHKRCFCNGKLAASSRCSNVSPLGRKRRKSKKVVCTPGTVTKSGRSCVCRQKGTGKIKRIQIKRCRGK